MRQTLVMDLRQLDTLIAVAEHGRFSAAARALHTVQSNVSTHIAKLENELGTCLVDRQTGNLTPEGEVVVARARRVHAEIEALSADVASMSSEVTGSVSIGVIGTTGRWIAAVFLDAMAGAFPGIEVSFVESTTGPLIPLLVNGQLDFAIITSPVEEPELAGQPLFNEALVAIAPLDHPLAAQGDRDTDIVELSKHDLLMGPPGSNLRDHIDASAEERNVAVHPLAVLDGVRLSATLAFQGYGPTIVPVTAIPTWAQRGDWVILSIPGMAPRTVALASRRRGMLSTAATEARSVLREMVAKYGPSQAGISVR